MESLVQVSSGDSNVVVGISGFGSAQIGRERWEGLARITGRTTYFLRYDAQTLPWAEGDAMVWTPRIYREMVDRWERARGGAQIAAKYLSDWLTRWATSGRKVLVVGFSLGGAIAWWAVQMVPDELKPQIELVLLSAAVGDHARGWHGLEHVGHVVNVFSSDDLALKYMYPQVVCRDETPAAGLGRLMVSMPNLTQVDVTDMVGRNHLWGSENIMRLARVALGALWGRLPVVAPGLTLEEGKTLSISSLQRLYRWVLLDPELWAVLGSALDGEPNAVALMERLDAWSLEHDRLLTLVDSGAAVVAMSNTRLGYSSSVRSSEVLRGLLRYWLTAGGAVPTGSSSSS